MPSMHRVLARGLSWLLLATFTLHVSVVQAAPNNYVRLALAYASEDDPDDATLFFSSLDGDRVLAGGSARFEGHLTDHATQTNHPYSVEIPADTLDTITLEAAPVLEDSEEQLYEIFQDGERVPVVLRMETTADPLKANSYVHSGTFLFEDTGKVVSFSALNDPVPVVIIIGGALVLLLCGANIIGELADSCADKAKRACAPNGVKTCEVEISVWSLITGCDSECNFTCHKPAGGVKPQPKPALEIRNR